MIILLLIGIALAGIAAGLLARAVANPGLRSSPPVAQIGRYGFGRRTRSEKAKVAVDDIVGRAVDTVGEQVAARWGKADEVRQHLFGAGVYRVSATKFLGY